MITFLVVSVVLLLLLRVPIALAFLVPSIIYIFLGDSLTPRVLVQELVGSVNSFPLVAIPLFLLMGVLANQSGATERLFDAAESLIGHLRASLAYVNILVSFVFSWMSGSALSDAAASGKFIVPEMVRRGYPQNFAIGLTGGSSLIGPVMPPSIPAVVYAVASGTSLGGMLIAGVIPAIIIGLCLVGFVLVFSIGKPGLKMPKASARDRVERVGRSLLSLATPVIVVGGILGGFFTPTEAAAVAVLYMFILCIVYKKMSIRIALRLLRSTAETTGSIMIIIAAAGVYTTILTYEGIGQVVSSLLLDITDSPTILLLVMVLVLLVVGLLVEPTAAILLMVPILFPVAQQLGVHPFQFGAVLILSLMIGLLTPPTGQILFALSSAVGVPVRDVSAASLPVLVPLIVSLLIIVFVPAATLWLPEVTGF